MEFNGMQLEVSEYMRNNNLVSVKEETENTAVTNTNGNEVPTGNETAGGTAENGNVATGDTAQTTENVASEQTTTNN